MDRGIEIFKDFPGFEDYYEISNWGTLRGKNRIVVSKNGIKKKIKEKKISYYFLANGYCHIQLKISNIGHHYLLHRAMAMAFLPNPLMLPEVNHKDEDKTNNFIYIGKDGIVNQEKSNLEWCDHRYNCNFGERSQKAGIKHRTPVRRISDGAVFSSIGEAAKKIGVSIQALSAHLHGKNKTCGGEEWEFI